MNESTMEAKSPKLQALAKPLAALLALALAILCAAGLSACSSSVEGTQVFSEEGVTVTVTGSGADDYGAYLLIAIENESDYDIYVTPGSEFTVDDTSSSTALAAQVNSGKTAKKQKFYLSDIATADELVGEISGTFTVRDSSSYDILFEPEVSFTLE